MDVAAKFHSFGCALGLHSATFDKICKDNLCGSEAALGQVIDAWLAQQYDTERFGEPSWRRLVSAVASPAGGNNASLALEIAEDHPGKQAGTYEPPSESIHTNTILCSCPSKTSFGEIN